MPQAIVPLALAISGPLTSATLAIGGVTGLATAHLVGAVIFTAVEGALYVGAGLALSSAVRPSVPDVPKPAAVQTPIRQTVAPRVSAFGECRLSGVYALYEAVDKESYDVVTLHSGRANAFTHFYLHDEEVTLSGSRVDSPDGRKYGGTGSGTIDIYTRLGISPETNYAAVTAGVPQWTSSHRGDGVSSLAMVCKQSALKDQQADFPTGVPIPSVAGEWQLIYDPRDPAQVQGDPSTYVYSDNLILALIAYLTDAEGGMGHDYARRILPREPDWIAAADVCDGLLTLTDGSQEKKYRGGGAYKHDSAPAAVISQIVASCDGWFAPTGDGAFTVQAGEYQAPTIAFLDKHVIAETVRYYVPDEEAVNELVVTFTNPATQFQEDQAGAPIQNTADIAARGVIRSQKMEFPWVPSASQARRLAERQMTRFSAELRGTTRTNLYGLNALGERYVSRQSNENAVLDGEVLEITKVQIDLAALAVSFDWVVASPLIDASDTGQSPANPPIARPTQASLVAPTITDITPVYEQTGSVDTGARLLIDVDSPLAQDVAWLVRWVPTGDTNWTEGPYSDIADGAAVQLLTGFVPAKSSLDVQVAYRTAGGQSPWSATFTIVTDAPTTNFDAAVAAVGAVPITASENLAAGDFVSFHNASGAKVRRTNATDKTRQVDGFVLAAVTAGQTAKVFTAGVNDQLSGLTPGATYFLDTSAGQITATPPTGSGNWLQEVGRAADATHLVFAPKTGTELA